MVEIEQDSKDAQPSVNEIPTREAVERDLQYLTMIIGMFQSAKEREWRITDSKKLANATADVIKTFRRCAEIETDKKWVKNTNQRILELKKEALDALEKRQQAMGQFN